MQAKIKSINIMLLWVFISLYIFYFGLISIIKFNSFAFYDFDLAVHDLSVWNILHGSIFNSILNIPFLGNHMNLILFLVAPLYLIFNHPLTLLFLQTLSLALTALPLYLLSKKILNENWALLIAILYLLYPALSYTNLYEFHPTVFATFFLTAAFYCYEAKSFNKFMVFSVLACLCQENIPLAIIMFGILALINRREKKWVIAPLLFGVIYLLIILLIQAYFNNNTVQFFHIYMHLGDTPLGIITNFIKQPMILLQALARKQVLIYILQVFLPLAFLPFLSPLKLIPALPFFLQHTLSNRLSDLTIYYHYTAEIIPFLFVGLIYSVSSLLKRGWAKNEMLLKVSLLLVVVLSRIFFGPSFFILPHLVRQQQIDYLDAYKDNFVKKIPAQASVVATFEFLSHLSHRRNLYSFHHVYIGYHTLSNKIYFLPESVETALIDFNDSLTFRGFRNSNGQKNLEMFLKQGKWQVEDIMETIVILKKNISPKYVLYEVVPDAHRQIQQKRAISVEGEIELIGCNFDNRSEKGVLGITFFWKSARPTKRDLNIFLDIVDRNGFLIMRKHRPICYMAKPTSTWKQGEVIKEESRIKIPDNLLNSRYRIKIGFFDLVSGMLCKLEGEVDNFGRALLFEADDEKNKM